MQLTLMLKPAAYVSRLRRLDITPAQTLRGRRDLAALNARFPALTSYEERAAPIRDVLAPLHRAYIREVSDDTMAISLELSVFLHVFAEIIGATALTDLGSGFSSFVLRRYAEEACAAATVWSVDDHPDWLGKTDNYLETQSLVADRLAVWRDFISQGHRKTQDLVLHDMGSMTFRAQTLGLALDLARSGGFVILDDVHKASYRAIVETELADRRLSYWSLKGLACDHRARYAYLVEI